ncbi:MAG: bifunctional 3'-5' exonuclease/DNA polymerase, partial [Microbacteriaceae bacterium]|nr:bifunctional 3'-5' exonuclease/DNA polymerase [Microbacteriaceae bacterium]
MHIVVDRRPAGVALIDDPGGETLVPESGFAAAVAEREAEHPRWVWTDTAQWYPPLLAAGVRVERCHDLRLVDAILAGIDGRPPRRDWGRAPAAARADTLFELDGAVDAVPAIAAPLDWQQQRDAIAAHADPARLSLLAAAESAGALTAAEMHHAGLPWSAAAHDA